MIFYEKAHTREEEEAHEVAAAAASANTWSQHHTLIRQPRATNDHNRSHSNHFHHLPHQHRQQQPADDCRSGLGSSLEDSPSSPGGSSTSPLSPAGSDISGEGQGQGEEEHQMQQHNGAYRQATICFAYKI
jgi:hypothetical protein